jgi:hypothetical protein
VARARKIDKIPVAKGAPKGQLSFKFEGLTLDSVRGKVGGASGLPVAHMKIGEHIRIIHEVTCRRVNHFRDKDGFMVREQVYEIDATKIERDL